MGMFEYVIVLTGVVIGLAMTGEGRAAEAA
jgi:hypothetical protein